MRGSFDQMLTVMSSRCRRGDRISMLVLQFTTPLKSGKLPASAEEPAMEDETARSIGGCFSARARQPCWRRPVPPTPSSAPAPRRRRSRPRPASRRLLSDVIAEFVTGFDLKAVPPLAIERARLAFIDTVGVMLAGSRSEPAEIICEMVRAEGAAAGGLGGRAVAEDLAAARGAGERRCRARARLRLHLHPGPAAGADHPGAAGRSPRAPARRRPRRSPPSSSASRSPRGSAAPTPTTTAAGCGTAPAPSARSRRPPPAPG